MAADIVTTFMDRRKAALQAAAEFSSQHLSLQDPQPAYCGNRWRLRISE